MRKLVALTVLALTLGGVSGESTAQAKAVKSVAVACPGVVQGVYYYRNATWGWQKQLGEKPERSVFNASKIHSCKYAKWVARTWMKRAREKRNFMSSLNSNPEVAICYVFGRYCSGAKAVAWCEGKYNVYAKNGQYLGTFQMGDSERAKYGHGYTILEQARAAWRYFDASGRDWSPWECKP